MKLDFHGLVDEVNQLKNAKRYPFLPIVEAVDHHRARLADAGEVRMFASCDYLGLSQDEGIKARSIDAIAKYGTNTFGAQIYSGHTRIHHSLEAGLAAFMEKEAALLFPSGMHANIGVITALMGPKDVVINDRLNHTSLFMGTQQSGAKQRNFRHADMNHLEDILAESQGCERRLIATDGVFSADGDIAPIKEICRLAKKYDAMVMVDEAHAVGIFGKQGRGAAEYEGALADVDIVMGTMSKAFGSVGGFVAASDDIVTYLRHAAPAYTSSRGSPPAVAAASLAALEKIRAGDALRAAVLANTGFVLTRLRNAGINCLNGVAPTIPVVVGTKEKAIGLSRWLLDRGILVSAMVPPTVPPGGSRIRLGITALHSQEDLDVLVELLLEARGVFDF